MLQQVVRLRQRGARLVDICDTLNADGILTPGGGLRWWPSHVHRLLRTRDGRELLDRARSQSQRHERAGFHGG
ncbi:recombinase family protein [Phytohabitans aurantiacus]|uniref:recombinase family protein n=1 Tax=Phytohabitans aurantiacus TaxID=3016789 RepID=UPI00389A4868